MSVSLKSSKGFAILGILFVLVVLAMAGSYMVKMGAANHAVVDLTLLEIRAKYAAKSALIIARKQWEQDFLCPAKNVYFSDRHSALNGFEVHFQCDTIVNGSVDNPHFDALHLQATAKKGQFGDRDYVSKQQNEWFIK